MNVAGDKLESTNQALTASSFECQQLQPHLYSYLGEAMRIAQRLGYEDDESRVLTVMHYLCMLDYKKAIEPIVEAKRKIYSAQSAPKKIIVYQNGTMQIEHTPLSPEAEIVIANLDEIIIDTGRKFFGT